MFRKKGEIRKIWDFEVLRTYCNTKIIFKLLKIIREEYNFGGNKIKINWFFDNNNSKYKIFFWYLKKYFGITTCPPSFEITKFPLFLFLFFFYFLQCAVYSFRIFLVRRNKVNCTGPSERHKACDWFNSRLFTARGYVAFWNKNFRVACPKVGHPVQISDNYLSR